MGGKKKIDEETMEASGGGYHKNNPLFVLTFAVVFFSFTKNRPQANRN